MLRRMHVVQLNNATGAGNSFGGWLVRFILNGRPIFDAIKAGIQAADKSLLCADWAKSQSFS
jgi:sugar/nucleoside kinase (ribokinase family)